MGFFKRCNDSIRSLYIDSGFILAFIICFVGKKKEFKTSYYFENIRCPYLVRPLIISYIVGKKLVLDNDKNNIHSICYFATRTRSGTNIKKIKKTVEEMYN
jgi:hypothetical protein